MAKWRNKINLKEFLTDNEDDSQVLICVNMIIPQLEIILKTERKLSKLSEHFLSEFEELIEEFKWIQESINNEDDPDGYGYSNWCEAFNGYLGQLYDMGDTAVRWNNEKFLWVG